MLSRSDLELKNGAEAKIKKTEELLTKRSKEY
jgi:hypothetical protein